MKKPVFMSYCHTAISIVHHSMTRNKLYQTEKKNFSANKTKPLNTTLKKKKEEEKERIH